MVSRQVLSHGLAMDMLFYFMIFYDIVFFAMGLVLSHPNVLKIENDKTQYIYIYYNKL